MGDEKQSDKQNQQNKPQEVKPLKETLKEYGRGITGGILFSLPLLYTMEMWWRGFTADPRHLLVGAGVTYLLLLGYNRYGGLRQDRSWWDIARDSFEEFSLAIMVSFLVLWLLNRIHFQMPANEIIGKVAIESFIVAIGISVGIEQLGGPKSKGKQSENPEKKGALYDLFHDVALASCGAILFASSVAPTMEIKKLAVGSGKVNILLMIFISIAMSAVILYFSDFKGGAKKTPPPSKMAYDMVVSYCVALAVSLGLMWFFGRIEGSLLLVVSEMVVLGIPASLGSSAGRLLIGS